MARGAGRCHRVFPTRRHCEAITLDTLTTSIVVSLAALITLCLMLRRSRFSLGMPIAYLGLLLLNHVPGAFAHAVSSELLTESAFTETGIMLTAIGAVSFV